MPRVLLLDCLPFLIAMAICVGTLRGLWWLSGAHCRPSAARQLFSDERGSVQSLSFVLTVPAFVMVMMFLVQLTQITMARLVVEYAAFAAARCAIVWIPASLPGEPPNHIGFRHYREHQSGPGGGHDVYDISMGGAKANRIRLAAAQACLAICPSRSIPGPPAPAAQVDAIWAGYQATTPEDDFPQRRRVLENKLKYALRRTRVDLDVYHPELEPPLLRYGWPWWWREFADDEIGWRDSLLLTVSHDYALLPGPGRVLARALSTRDSVANRIVRHPDGTYTYRLTASVSMANEGQKAVRTLRQNW